MMNDPAGPPNPPADPPELVPDADPGPTLASQFLGVFTEPVPLFRRLGRRPRWGGALAAILASAVGAGLVWAARVDADALLRPVLAADPRVPPDQLEAVLAFQGRFLGLAQAATVLTWIPAVTLLLAGGYWLVARAATGPRPGFRRALCVAVVPGLVLVPRFILTMVLCLAVQVGGRTPDLLSPLSLGAWLGPGRGWPAALLRGFDLFALASLALLYLAARHTLRLRTVPALACVALSLAVSAGLMVLGAR